MTPEPHQPTPPPGSVSPDPASSGPVDRQGQRPPAGLPAVDRPATDVVAGRYALCDPLDSGGSGTVWRAWDLTLGRYCAAKLLRRREAGQLLRFVREQAVRLDGDHIASPYAWAAEDADVLIATELIDGGSLHQLVAAVGALSEPTVAVLLDQMLAGLEHVHQVGLVHRDVKPGNVLLRATGTGAMDALLIDFGLAIRMSDARLTELGTVIGTPGYLPPELARAETGPAPAQDLFAAGRTAMALLSAIEPKMGVRQDFPIADPVLRQVLDALAAAEPEGRPPSAAAARNLLRGARFDPVPRTRDGRLLTLGSQLPPLPDGWHPERGPASGARMMPARGAVATRQRGMTIVDATGLSAAAAVGGAPGPGPAGNAGAWAELGVGRPDATGPTRVPSADRPPGSGAESAAAPAFSSATRAPRPPSRWPWLVGGLGLALAVAAIVTAIVVRSNPPPANESDVPATGTDVSSSSQVSTDPAGPGAGDECTFLAEGDTEIGPKGPVECMLDDAGSYRWQTA